MHGHPPSINFNNSPFSEKLGNTRIDPIGTLYECHLFMGFAILALLSFVNGDVENGYILFVLTSLTSASLVNLPTNIIIVNDYPC
jgi:hypothetical protein